MPEERNPSSRCNQVQTDLLLRCIGRLLRPEMKHTAPFHYYRGSRWSFSSEIHSRLKRAKVIVS